MSRPSYKSEVAELKAQIALLLQQQGASKATVDVAATAERYKNSFVKAVRVLPGETFSEGSYTFKNDRKRVRILALCKKLDGSLYDAICIFEDSSAAAVIKFHAAEVSKLIK